MAYHDISAPVIVAAGQRVRKLDPDLGIKSAGIGCRGDELHTYGYHRGRSEVSDYSTRDPRDRKGDPQKCSALDLTAGSPKAQHTMTQRLIDGYNRRDPRMRVVREFYGSVDSKNVVGRDLITRTFASSDDSHTWHVHISGFREFVDDADAWNDLADLLAGVPLGATAEPNLLEYIVSLDRNSKEYQALVADVAAATAAKTWGLKLGGVLASQLLMEGRLHAMRADAKAAGISTVLSAPGSGILARVATLQAAVAKLGPAGHVVAETAAIADAVAAKIKALAWKAV